MWHYTRQKIGWVQYSTKKIKGKRNFIDELMVYNVCLIPFFWHLTDNTMEYKSLYMFNDITLFALPSQIFFYLGTFPIHLNLLTLFTSIFWGINILWIFTEIKTILTSGIINPVKYYVILSGIICFAVSYMIFADKIMFWVPNVLVHTSSYILFTYFFSKNHKTVNLGDNKKNVQYIFLKNIFLYMILILVYGSMIFFMAEHGKRGLDSWQINFIPLAFSFFFIHYVTDAFIWKKRFMKPRN